LLKSTAASNSITSTEHPDLLVRERRNGGFVGAPESVQLLAGYAGYRVNHRSFGNNVDHDVSDEKTKSAAPSWGASLVEMSSDIMYEEKKMEVPVMKILTARDALLDVCVNKFTHQIAK